MQSPLPLTRDLVLIGGGHTHALVLRKWGMAPVPGVRLTLISPAPVATYSGMLPGYIAGHYTADEIQIDLVRLARFAGARLVLGAATGIDRTAGTVQVTDRPDIRFDSLSIDVGIHTDMPDLPGFAAHGVPAKPFERLARGWSAWLDAMQSGEAAPHACVIGAGLAGAELALAMRHRLATDGIAAELTLLDSTRALTGIGGRTRALLMRRLRDVGIRLLEGAQVRAVEADAVQLKDGRRLPSGFTVGVAGARPHHWIASLGLATCDGFLRVDRELRSLSDPRILAAGDCAHLDFAPRPKAGVFAVRAAPVLWANLRADLTGTAPRRFRPQASYLKLVSLGGREAVADKAGLSLSGRWVWRWKDRIDRTFMARFHDLPEMPAPKLPAVRARDAAEAAAGPPVCGGCGAKVARPVLTQALAQLTPPARTDVLSTPGDDAAVLDFGDRQQVLTTDHLRAFTEDPVTMARIAAVHALGDIWAMGAEPQAALASITLPRMNEAMQAATLREILDTAAEVFRGEGAEIVGGHTSLGAEMAIGFTVTGLASASPITLAGARPGDALILTRPIGSGTLLAAEMQRMARGADVAAALATMGRTQGAAARHLRGANAMTDVTGFGLAGHLMGICEASGVKAELALDAIPFFAGAVDLAAAGIRSTLHPANRQIAGVMTLPEDPRAELLFDPQTAGGLLAAVPAEPAEALLMALLAEGVEATQIGRILPGPPAITVR